MEEERMGFLPWEEDLEMMSRYQDRKVSAIYSLFTITQQNNYSYNGIYRHVINIGFSLLPGNSVPVVHATTHWS